MVPASAADPIRLDGKAAIVTGAARGIGLAVADVLARRGADVAAADVLDLEPARARIEAHGSRALCLPADVSKEEDVDHLVAETAATLGSVDVLVCCAGIYGGGGFEEVDEADWRRVIDVNLLGTYLCLRAAFREMQAHGGGSILTVGSVAGYMGGYASGPQYAASKGGIHAMSRWAAAHGAPQIRVNVLVPGAVDTEMIRGRGYPEEISPLGRQAQASEIAEVAAFVVSDAASYMTGASVAVNGGFLMV